jgi:polyphosphate glucokinase
MLEGMTDTKDAPTAVGPPPFPGDVDAGTGVIGVDIGGSGIKAAPVDLDAGTLTAARVRIDTPHPATPEAVAATVAEVVGRVVQECGPVAIAPQAPVGITLPSVIRGGVVRTAANIDPAWIGVHAADLFGEALGRPVVVVNDADAAGVAEVRFGAGRDVKGVVLMLTLGTGIGSALFVDGVLVPNTELGHLPLHGGDAERYAASSVRKAENLSMKKYAKRLQEYLRLVERLIWPDLILIGGGISKRADEFLPHIKVDTPVQPAQLRNEAGIVGAAVLTPSA